MHRLHRPLKPNIPYNKKNPLFKRRLRSYVQPPFLLLRFRIELLLQLKFSLSTPPVNNLSACYVQISAATVYTAL